MRLCFSRHIHQHILACPAAPPATFAGGAAVGRPLSGCLAPIPIPFRHHFGVPCARALGILDACPCSRAVICHASDTYCLGESTVTFLIIFTLGYLLGGVSALFILGLTVAARRGDRV